MIPSIYLNLEDDVAKVATRIKRERSEKVVLVCPKRCFLFNDSINLRLLKKQTDLLGKQVFILTMDERGQSYAQEAGFELKTLPKTQATGAFSDIRVQRHPEPVKDLEGGLVPHALSSTVKEIKNLAKFWQKPKAEEPEVLTWPPSVKKAPVHNRPAPAPRVKITDSVFPKELEQAYRLRRKQARNQKLVMAVAALSLVVVLAVVFVVLPRASVTIHPKSEPLTRDLEITMSPNIQSPDPSRLVLPATKIDRVLEVSGKFQSQGKKEVGNKAAGTVRIYNFTRSPINLKANTTTLLLGSKSYVLASDVAQLRPTGYKDSRTKEIDEATLGKPVEIIAAEGGESYNVPAGTRLEISNQVFGSQPQFLYAKTESAITGGTSRYLSVVTEQDLSASKEKLKSQALIDLSSILSHDDLVLTDKAYTLEEQEYVSDRSAGTESPTYEAALKLKVTGLAYKAPEINKLIVDRISQAIPPNKELQLGSTPLDVKVKNMDFSTDLATLSVHFEGRAVYKVEISNLSEELAGKSQNQVMEILNSRQEIEKIDITVAPSWQKNFPWFSGKIKVVKSSELVAQ